VGQPRGGEGGIAERRFDGARFIRRDGLRAELVRAMCADGSIALRLCRRAEENFKRSVASKICACAARFLNCIYKFGIKPQALFSERNERDVIRRLRSRAKHPGGRPGCFQARLLPIENDNAQILARKPVRQRKPDDSAANDNNVG